jgi:purine-binding chemotaxis protein CheW
MIVIPQGVLMPEVSFINTPHQLVVFRVGGTHYGIDIESVDEILPVLPITATPGVVPGVLGLADVRKQVVPVFDLHVRFGVPAPESSGDTRLVLVETSAGSVAMLVDCVEEVLTVRREEFQSVATPGSAKATGYLQGVVRKDDKLILWVDHEGLVPAGIAAPAALGAAA